MTDATTEDVGDCIYCGKPVDLLPLFLTRDNSVVCEKHLPISGGQRLLPSEVDIGGWSCECCEYAAEI